MAYTGLKIYAEKHSADEDRFIAIGTIRAGAVVVLFTEREEDLWLVMFPS